MIVHSVRRMRRCDAPYGLTLVELLVTIMIIGILSSSVLFAMSAAQESARKSRTQALIATLHGLVIERWESYLTRRYNANIVDEYTQGGVNKGPKHAARIRYKLIKQFLKMDFPDQWQDVQRIGLHADPVPAATQTYLHISYENKRFWANDYLSKLPSLTAAERQERLEQNEGAECLYQIIEYARGDATNFQMMPSTFIGDTDSDSLPEYLDGWGRPVTFIRWPAGFISELQNGQKGKDSTDPPNPDPNKNGWLDHDPFDPLRTESGAYRLVPLIMSAGPDGVFDVFVVKIRYEDPFAPDLPKRWDPYITQFGLRAGEVELAKATLPPNGTQIPAAGSIDATPATGSNGIEEWHDNIHNHLISIR